MKSENLEQLNKIIVQPLREALINNEHVKYFDDAELFVKREVLALNNPDFSDEKILKALDDLLYRILLKGQKVCNSKFLALSYGYTYLYQRINAIENAFKILNYAVDKTRETGLFVDVGCGIGALLVALRNLHENTNFVLNYRGYDIAQEVINVNSNMLKKIYPNNHVNINHNCIESFGKDDDIEIKHVIMVFSYIFNQDGIDDDAIDSFKQRVDSLFNEFDLDRFYIVYINIKPPYFNNNFINFMEKLKHGGYEIVSQNEQDKEVENKRLYNLSTVEENIKLVPGLKPTSKVHCTVSEIRRV